MVRLGELVVILDLHRQGLSVSAIARRVGIDRKTVRKYIERGLEPPLYRPRQPRPAKVTAFQPLGRDQEGGHGARQPLLHHVWYCLYSPRQILRATMTQPASVAVRPMQWSLLPELHAAPPLDATDLACLDELRSVLVRHGKLNRFALHLAHRHFELMPDEILIERPDPDGRTQHVMVGRRDDYPDAVPTTWLFDDASTPLSLIAAVYCACMPTKIAPDTCVRHGKTNEPMTGGWAREEEEIKQRRIAEEKAAHERGGPVAGHDPSDKGRGR